MADNNTHNTTELIALRNEVAQLKKKLSDCCELAEMGHWQVDMLTGEVAWSERHHNLFDLPDEELPPQSFKAFLQYVHQEDRHIVVSDWYELTRAANVFTRQFRIITRSGKRKHVRSTIRSVFCEDQLIKIHGVYKDTTSIFQQELNHNLEQLRHQLFKDHELNWMGGYEIDLSTDELTLSESLQSVLEMETGQEHRTLWEFIDQYVVADDRARVSSMVSAIRNQTSAGEQYRIGPNAIQLHYRVRTLRSQQTLHVISRYIRIFKNGRPIKINGLLVDVTLTKKRETELLKSREQFQSLFNNMTQGVVFYNTAGVILNVNRASEMMMGVKKEDVIGKYLFDFNLTNLKKDGTVMRKEEHPIQFTLRTGKPVNNVIYGVVDAATKYVRWMRTSFIPTSSLLDSGVFFGLYEDVTESLESIDLLRETNAQLTLKNEVIGEANRKLIETKKELRGTLMQLELKAGILNQLVLLMVSDLSGHIIEMNDRFLKVLGYEREEVIGKPDFLLPDNMFQSGVHSREYYTHRRELISQGNAWRGEICKKTKSGKLIWLLETILPLMNDKGEIERIYFYNNEITPLKIREETITHEKRAAEQAAHVKEEFLSRMSHEIRTPLNSVIGLTNLLLRRNPREDQMEMVQALKNSSDNLLHLVNTILDYNKLQAGKTDLEQTQFNLSDYIRHINISSRMITMENGIQWELKLDPTLPEIVQGDMGRINQILNNLINNAIKFTLQGNIHLEVRLQARIEQTAYVVFVLSDSGIGIPNEKIDKIFHPFYQVNLHGHQNLGGTGLGLAIVKELVDLLKGHITVQSTLGKGSVFSVELPLQLPTQEELHIVTEKLSVDSRIKLKGCKVLYVEDVESNRFVVENILSDMNIEVTTAGSGQEALLLTDKFSYDVILMDIQMPDLNGYRTVESLRKQVRGKNKNTPIIAFTAKLYNEKLKENLAKYHIQDVVMKPFNTEVLLEKIAQARLYPTVLSGSRNKIISFRFYEIALHYNREKLAVVRKELLHDVEQLEKDIKRISKNKTVPGTEIHDSTHRLRPIARNLECESLQLLLDDYQNHTQYSEKLKELNQKALLVLKKVKKALEELPYELTK